MNEFNFFLRYKREYELVSKYFALENCPRTREEVSMLKDLRSISATGEVPLIVG